ncbi:ABC-2 type transport system permease protein [Agromyces hippuratus]|uniref:ABC-2 type transport system permease protein n=1 Tax=Agromyces hippuratus TaxID=286438 RepID=A0A852WZB4_9MICO|nr:ABC transporter permease [Agromyces hippuratus]NYG21560.1 ABC-2 type transport system permease protein [Agromyces hippuratus]
MTLDTSASRTRSTDDDRSAPGFVETVRLISGREITMRMRSKAFLISTGVLMLAVLASVVLGSMFGSQSELPKVAVVAGATDVVEGNPALEAVPAADQDAAEQMLRDGDVEAIVAPAASEPLGIVVLGLESAPNEVVAALSVSPTVELLDPAAVDPMLAYFVAFGFGIVFFMSALTFGTTIAQSVVEEKQTRVVEILLSTVSARALLTGKVIGNSLLAFGQILAIAVLALLGLMLTGQRVLLGGLGPSVIWFIVFFAIGFVMLAALFAATAALVSRAEDIGTVTTPVTMLVMIPYFLVIFFNDNPTVLAIMSYVPFSAPVGMPMRVFLGSAEWWEPFVSLAILLATAALAVVIGERIYRSSLLKTGARVPWGEALKG